MTKLPTALLIALTASTTAFADNHQSSFKADTQPCPADFYQLPLFPEARLCQIFAQTLPASMTYHADTDQSAVQEYYQQALGDAESVKTQKGRVVMQYRAGDTVLILSPDGKGTQVDMLVKSAPTA